MRLRRLGVIAGRLIVIAGLIGLVLWRALDASWRAAGPLSDERIVQLPAGAGLPQIARVLQASGAIQSDTLFLLGLIAFDMRSLKAGEYALPAHASMMAIASVLKSGKVVQHPVLIPEGWTSREIVDELSRLEFLDGPLPKTVPEEGSLRPETYLAERGASRQHLIERMRLAQTAQLDQAIAQAGGLPDGVSRAQVLVLASIVERESALAAERSHIAGVFLRRLARGMRLQSDPTVIYGLSNGYGTLDHELTRNDLAKPTAWNTYLLAGLPATPICNPGRDAIEAVLHPDGGDDLYFVADGTGGHRFAATLAEHNRNVSQWRRIEANTAH